MVPGRRRVIDGALLAMTAALAGLVLLAWARGGPELVRQGLALGSGYLLRFGLLISVSFLAAGLAEVVLPRTWIPSALGPEAGLRGILVATGAGAITPSGPFIAIPIAAALARSGAGTGALVAYVSAWGLIALHRLVAWEIPILGARLALLRWGVSVALPVIAGLAARALARS
jgi:uncharacterized membrane protein YraQ (UPF0718 family)